MQALRIVVVVMGIMIVVGVAVIAVTIAKRAGMGTNERDAPEPAVIADFGSLAVSLPPGERLVGELVEEGSLILKTRAANGGTSYVVVDLATGRTRGTLRAVEAP